MESVRMGTNMNFKIIDLEKYKRKEHFLHYLNNVPCFYSMTANIDITDLQKYIKEKEYKLYPVLIYAITRIANNHIEFKMSLDDDDNLGYFTEVNPSYTIFHKDNNTFSNIWTKYNSNFIEFYKNYKEDMRVFGDKKGFITKKCENNNMIDISAIPWASFTGFNLNLPKGDKYLLPIFTIGKYYEENNKILLPLAVQVHHSVCDGFHTSRFINEFQELLNHFENII